MSSKRPGGFGSALPVDVMARIDHIVIVMEERTISCGPRIPVAVAVDAKDCPVHVRLRSGGRDAESAVAYLRLAIGKLAPSPEVLALVDRRLGAQIAQAFIPVVRREAQIAQALIPVVRPK